MFREISDSTVGISTTTPEQSLSGAFRLVAGEEFLLHIKEFCKENPHRCSDLEMLGNYDAAECWIKSDGLAGFAITQQGELSNLFSKSGGQGSQALIFAQERYDRLHLNCFDGLQTFYSRHGFEVLKTEKNWYDTPERTLPAVLYMTWEKK